MAMGECGGKFFPRICVIVVVTLSAIYLVIFLEPTYESPHTNSHSGNEKKNFFFWPKLPFWAQGVFHSSVNFSSSLGLRTPKASEHLC